MRRTTKFIILFAALLLPALIYVFLKSFGKNEFDVPVLYQDSVATPVGCDSYVYTTPYVVPENVLTALQWSPEKVNVFVVGDVAASTLLRAFDEFPEMGFKVKEVGKEERTIATCALLLQPPFNTAVVDSQGRIRGQYDISDRDDLDRLVVEMKILLLLY